MKKNTNLIRNLLLRGGVLSSLKEIFILCWGYPCYIISFLIPRNKEKIVFGNKIGFADNVKYLYLYFSEHTNIHCYWITTKKKYAKQLRKRGINAYYRFSIKGFYHCATSFAFVYCITCNHLNYWVSGGARLINLWHGVGIKSVKNGKKSLYANSFLSKIIMPHAYKEPSLFLSTSPLMNNHFEKELSLPSRAIYEGIYPRCSFLRQGKDVLMKHIKNVENEQYNSLIESIQKYSCVYIYMPTWRGDLSDNFLNTALPDVEKLNNVLKETNSLFLLKLHPNLLFNKSHFDQYDSILYLDPKMDVYPLLPFTNILITDYSSIYYDYLLIEDKGVILYPFDEEKYNDEDYPFSFDYDKYTPGVRVRTFNELLSLLIQKANCFVDEREWVLNQFWGDFRNKDTEQLYKTIISI